MDFSVGEFNSLLKKSEWALGGAGFFFGVTAKQPGQIWPNKVAAFVSDFGIAGVNVGGIRTTNNLIFQPTGFINKGFWAALLLGILEAVVPRSGRLGQAVHIGIKAGLPVAIGYSVGGFLDPAGSPGVVSSSQAVRGAGRGASGFAGGSLTGSFY